MDCELDRERGRADGNIIDRGTRKIDSSSVGAGIDIISGFCNFLPKRPFSMNRIVRRSYYELEVITIIWHFQFNIVYRCSEVYFSTINTEI